MCQEGGCTYAWLSPCVCVGHIHVRVSACFLSGMHVCECLICVYVYKRELLVAANRDAKNREKKRNNEREKKKRFGNKFRKRFKKLE